MTLKARADNGPRIAHQVLAYPALQYGWDTTSAIENAEGYGRQRATLKYFWQHLCDERGRRCQPLLLAAARHEPFPSPSDIDRNGRVRPLA